MIRRVLAFVALFGSGLFVLLQLDRVGTPRVDSRRPVHVAADFSDVRLRPNGPLFYVNFDDLEGGERVRRFSIDAPDSGVSEDGGVILQDPRMEFYEDGGLKRVSLLRARRARIEVALGGGDTQPRLSDTIQFEDAVLRAEAGSRLLPLTLSAARLDGDLEARRFETDGPARIEGVGLDARGVGLLADEIRGRLDFQREGRLEIRVPKEDSPVAGDDMGGSTGDGKLRLDATLQCEGNLSFEQIEDGALRVVALRKAVLTVKGEEPLVLSGERIEIRARQSGAEGDVLVFENLEATRDVVLRSRGNVFRAESARFALDAEAQLSNATLTGNPRGALLVSPPGTDLEDEVRIEVWGRGPMTLSWRPERRFQVAGPAELRWEGSELWAAGGISGSVGNDGSVGNEGAASAASDADGEGLSFRAWGDVEVTREGWTLETPELRGRGNERELHLAATGPGVLRGEREDGTRLGVLARDGLDFSFDDDTWSVPVARGVDLDWSGERRLFARADRIEDLTADLEKDLLAFEATGAVEVESDDNFLRGERLVATSPRDAQLFGDGELALATYTSTQGEVRAQSIERSGDALTAHGDVDARLDVPTLQGRVRAQTLVVTGLPDDERSATAAPVVLDASGGVEASFVAANARYAVNCQTLRIERAPGPTRDAQAGTTYFAARGGVRANLDMQAGEFRLRADEVLAESSDLGLGPDDEPIDPRGQLIATGGVELGRLGQDGITGSGDRLILDHTGTGRLEPRPGERVIAFGRLPDGEQPFDLDAAALEFEAERIEAWYPRIRLPDLGAEASAEDVTAVIAPRIEASANRLVAETGRMRMFGNCRFDGQTARGRPWSLTSDRAELLARSGSGKAAAPFEELIAEGNVVVDFSEGQRALTNKLIGEGWSRRLRLEGGPNGRAVFLDSRTIWEADSIELDTHNLLPSSGPGTWRQRVDADRHLGGDGW